jgi:hypothetical protein
MSPFTLREEYKSRMFVNRVLRRNLDLTEEVREGWRENCIRSFRICNICSFFNNTFSATPTT